MRGGGRLRRIRSCRRASCEVEVRWCLGCGLGWVGKGDEGCVCLAVSRDMAEWRLYDTTHNVISSALEKPEACWLSQLSNQSFLNSTLQLHTCMQPL